MKNQDIKTLIHNINHLMNGMVFTPENKETLLEQIDYSITIRTILPDKDEKPWERKSEEI